MEIDEAKRLINASEPAFRNLVQAALQTGARLSELTRLTVADFKKNGGTVHVQRSKSGKERYVVLTSEGVTFFASICQGPTGYRRIVSWLAQGGSRSHDEGGVEAREDHATDHIPRAATHLCQSLGHEWRSVDRGGARI